VSRLIALTSTLLVVLAAGCRRSDRSVAADSGAPSASARDDCTLAGCPPAFVLTIDLAVPFGELPGSKLKICRNADCVAGVVAAEAKPPDPHIVVPVTFEERSRNGSYAHVGIQGEPGGALSLDVQWRMTDSTSVRSGDVYRVVLTDRAGRQLLERTEHVSAYRSLHPNGENCPPSCRSISVDRRRR
jgi:hypothetical protein